ncbi:taurine ABC transporter ATP-binding protein [Celeribacter indicus]|uniref:Taurine transporter ATP-binding subunit n=1 Tax=Celeribacter indicus TaxID=1208324 RepID=A0A0B5DTP0_9RHOB|nr:ATP-binding cassette domain-containing protein [Celeribacter indicus]AJE46798.1 taurine transporter ATP-binding subunit [Celeribacter indicus]SDW81674.1 taurine transport system ATP-binding protein [Celeribacter indicus]
MSALRLSQVSLHYGATGGRAAPLVLEDISLTLDRGEFLSVIGRSGSGKTSLLNLAAGFVAPSSGRVEVDGNAVTGPGPDRAVVFQDDALFPWRRVLENVALPLKLAGVPRADRLERAHHWLTEVGLAGQGGKFVWQLSGGQRQRVGIARALAAEPRFLLMDEPLGALDAMTRDQMHELLLKLWQESHAGALLITHSVEEAVFLSTSVVVLAPEPGRIAFREELDFGRRFLAGEDPRSLKSEPAFIAARERLLAAIHEKETAR